MISATQKRWAMILILSSLASLVLFMVARDPSDEIVTPVSKGDSVRLKVASGEVNNETGIAPINKRGVLALGKEDLFKSRSWFIPPPPPKKPPPPPPLVLAAPVVPQQPPPPMAPPLPYGFLGTYDDANGAKIIYLTMGGRIYPTKVGDVLGGNLRVEGIKGGYLTFNYLPLNMTQTLPVGGY